MTKKREHVEDNSINGDIDLEKIDSEEEDYFSGPAEYDISTYPADYPLEVLYTKWKNKDIEIPKFQRKFVWTQIQASKLIESFLVGLPVPAIYLYTQLDTQKNLVIDGQQRLKSIFYFLEGFFGEEEREKRTVFLLKGLSEKSKWNNKSFNDFDESDQRKLKNCILRAFIVKQLNPKDETSIYHIFERLNTGGTLLTNQEIRNCVYRGKFNNSLYDLNSYQAWRSILGKPIPDSRQKDIELILRFFALRNLKGYEKPLKDHLSRFMKRNRNPAKEFLEENKKLFQDSCDKIVSVLGTKPFHIKAGLNSAVYDCVMVAFAKNLHKVSKDIKQRYQSLIKNDEFTAVISGGTTDVDTVYKRFRIAEETLFKG